MNDLPTALDDSDSTDEDVAVSVPVLANDSDPEGDTLTITSVSTPGSGTATISGSTIVYTPDPNYNGPDSFTFTANDGNQDSAIATISITVNPVNDPPVANNQSVSTDEDVALPITLTGSDIDGDPLTYTVTA